MARKHATAKAVTTKRPIIDAIRAEPEPGESGFLESASTSGRRSLEAMLLSLPDELDQASYAQQRLKSYEWQMGRLLEALNPKALEILLSRNGDWRRLLREGHPLRNPPPEIRQKK